MKTTSRSFFILVLLVLVVDILPSSSAAFSLWNQTDFNNCIKLTETVNDVNYDYRLYWSLVGDSIHIGLAAQTSGWMGLGLSTDGSMGSSGSGSDIWVGWFGDTPDACAKTHGCVIDYWVTDQVQPEVDAVPNLFNPSFGAVDGYKWVSFTRALNTNDTAQDRIITPDQPQYIIHALGPSIPASSVASFDQHISGTNQASYIQFGQPRWECNDTSPNTPTTQVNYYSNSDQTWHVYWSLVDDGQSVEFNVSAFTSSSWWALGINTVESMVGADILWCSVGSDGGIVIDRRASAHATPGQDASQDVTLVSYQMVDGWSTCQIRRKLNTGDTQGDLVITDSSMVMLWAFGPTSGKRASIVERACDEPGFCQHAGNTKGIALVNFVSGGSDDVAITDDRRKAHGILMLFTWGLVAVAGAFIARYCKTPQGKWVLYGYIWVHLHGFLGVTTFIFNLIAFALIVDYVRDGDDNHFTGAHQVIGLIMFICTFFQPLIGVIAELFLKKYKDPNWVAWVIGTTHAWFGRALVLLGVVEVYLGLALYCVPTYVMVTYGVSVACMMALFLVHEPLRWFAPWGSWLGGPGFTYQRADDGDGGTEMKEFSPENKIPWMNMRPQRHPPLVVKICLWTLQVGLATCIIGLWIATAVGIGKKDINDPNDSYDSTCQIGDKFE